jgi:hypothetical protein
MGIGIGLFLIALGAIITFAVEWCVAGLDLNAVGWVLMVVGAAGLILFFYFWNQRRVPQTVAAVRQRPVTLTPPRPAAETAATAPLPPAQDTAVIATAPVPVSSRGRPEDG